MINYDLIGRALLHPVAQDILETLRRYPAPLGAAGLGRLLNLPLGKVAYHVKMLAGDPDGPFVSTPLLALHHTEQKRGAVAHFYVLSKAATR